MTITTMFELTSAEQTMTSREIAEITGKEHRSVLRDCDVLNENYEKLSLHKIVQSTYQADNGQVYRQYLLTKMQTFDLMTGYSIELRIRVNRRWEELEKKNQNRLDFTDPATVLQLAQNWHDEMAKRQLAESKVEEQAVQLEKQASKVRYHDEVLNVKGITFTNVIAKEMGTSAISLNKFLNRQGVIYKSGGVWVLYHKYQDKKYTALFTETLPNGFKQQTTVWTEKGRKFIHSLAKSHKVFNYRNNSGEDLNHLFDYEISQQTQL